MSAKSQEIRTKVFRAARQIVPHLTLISWLLALP